MTTDPQQEIFSAMLIGLRGLGYDVYDGALPPEGTKYPFIYMSDSQQVDTGLKGIVLGQVTLTFDVWHDNFDQRGIVSQTLLSIKGYARSITKTQHYSWFVPANSVDQQIMPDTTTRTPLLHGVLFVTFKFS